MSTCRSYSGGASSVGKAWLRLASLRRAIASMRSRVLCGGVAGRKDCCSGSTPVKNDTCRTGLFLQQNFDAVRIVGLAALVEEPSSLQFFTDLSQRLALTAHPAGAKQLLGQLHDLTPNTRRAFSYSAKAPATWRIISTHQQSVHAIGAVLLRARSRRRTPPPPFSLRWSHLALDLGPAAWHGSRRAH
jgi:hypothetical protein